MRIFPTLMAAAATALVLGATGPAEANWQPGYGQYYGGQYRACYYQGHHYVCPPYHRHHHHGWHRWHYPHYSYGYGYGYVQPQPYYYNRW